MKWSCFALVLAFAACGEASVLRGRAESMSMQLEESGMQLDEAEASQAETEDRMFLLSQLDQTESQLKELQQFVEAVAPVEKKVAVAAKPAAPVAKKEAAPVAKKEVVAAKKDVVVAAAKKVTKEAADPAKMLASLKLPKSMALAPMLAMLKGLYEESKDRISQQNVREEKSKKWFAGKEAEHVAKLATIEGKFANHTLSQEFRTNETRDEARYFNYWQRCRERQHRQFHTNLKIQHAMMTKTKKMITMYDAALSPKAADQAKAKKMLGGQTGMPEIVFLQNFDEVKRQVVDFCRDSLDEVDKEKDELHKDADAEQKLAAAGVTW